jgi:hypothetical protein
MALLPLQQNQRPTIGRTTKMTIMTMVLILAPSERVYLTVEEELEAVGAAVSSGVATVPLSVAVGVDVVFAGAGSAVTIAVKVQTRNRASKSRKIFRAMSSSFKILSGKLARRIILYISPRRRLAQETMD